MRHVPTPELDAMDRAIINGLQGGFPVSERPYGEAAEKLGLDEAELLERLGRLLDNGALSRFGPLFNADRMGGGAMLAAMEVPEDDFERVTGQVNAFPEVAHNYARDHAFNMWFVISAERVERIAEVQREIEAVTGLSVHAMPKLEEYYIGLRLEV